MSTVAKWLVILIVFEVLDFSFEAKGFFGFGLEFAGAVYPLSVFFAVLFEELLLAL